MISGDAPASVSIWERNMTAKPRTCLKCSRTFWSRGPGNRVCPACDKANRPSPPVSHPVSPETEVMLADTVDGTWASWDRNRKGGSDA